MSLPARAGTGAPDSQLWSEYDATARLGTRWTIRGIAQARFSETLANPVYTSLGTDLGYDRGHWTLSVGYRHQVTGHETDEPKITQLALLIASYATKFGPNSLALRCRVENAFNSSGNPWRVRLRVEYRRASGALQPISYLFANDEVFYQFQASEWYRNRFQAGVNWNYTQRTSLRIYYQRQDDRLNTPGAVNALGVTVSSTFK
jgi:hypothetical protein